MTTETISRQQGTTVFNSTGYRKISSVGDYAYPSALYTDLLSTYGSKHAVDSCWETGNIYYADSATGIVGKMSFNGNALASLSLTSPTAISVVQNESKMSVAGEVEDRGCWIIDGTSLIKTDYLLNVEKMITGLSNPVMVIASRVDYGCFIVDINRRILQFDSNADLVAFGQLPGGTYIDIASNSYGELVILGVATLYGYSGTNGSIVQDFTADIQSSVLSLADLYVGSVDVDTSTSNQYIYVALGSAGPTSVPISGTSGKGQIEIMKFSRDGIYVSGTSSSAIDLDLSYPFVLRACQHPLSNHIYLLSNVGKHSVIESSSSSSSSSSGV